MKNFSQANLSSSKLAQRDNKQSWENGGVEGNVIMTNFWVILQPTVIARRLNTLTLAGFWVKYRHFLRRWTSSPGVKCMSSYPCSLLFGANLIDPGKPRPPLWFVSSKSITLSISGGHSLVVHVQIYIFFSSPPRTLSSRDKSAEIQIKTGVIIPALLWRRLGRRGMDASRRAEAHRGSYLTDPAPLWCSCLSRPRKPPRHPDDCF